jgi:hypothetical protein
VTSFHEMAAFVILEEENRRNLCRNRIFRDRTHALDIYDDVDLIKRYRMPRHVLLEIIDLVYDDVVHPTRQNHAIPPSIHATFKVRAVISPGYLNHLFRG